MRKLTKIAKKTRRMSNTRNVNVNDKILISSSSFLCASEALWFSKLFFDYKNTENIGLQEFY